MLLLVFRGFCRLAGEAGWGRILEKVGVGEVKPRIRVGV